MTRGLYGSSLWLDMQGYQWPYYPRIGVGISGYGWVDTDFKRTRIGDPGQSDHNTKLFMQGRYDLRVTPTYSNGVGSCKPRPSSSPTSISWMSSRT